MNQGERLKSRRALRSLERARVLKAVRVSFDKYTTEDEGRVAKLRKLFERIMRAAKDNKPGTLLVPRFVTDFGRIR